MGYTALYRKFRPVAFEDVKGQDHIVTTLKNQIKSDRIGHAYLFCGTRGTGKTTIAKILAKAVNCEHPVDGSPCGECPVCRKIAEGTSMNVIEIDAASNNGVDNIREIIDEVQYSPTEGKYKVYIIDEVHMLSTGAFNALLKTLEEPPSYVIFILATTEAHKIPVTILSRCQRYDFRRITIDTIADRLAELMEIEGNEVEEKALRYVAKAGDGSMRDALSLLDQCLAFYFGKKLTYDNVLEVLGAVDVEVFGRLFRMICGQDMDGVLSLLEEIVTEGRDLTQFANDMTWYFRNLLLIATSENGAERIDVSTDQMNQMKEDAGRTDPESLMRYIRVFSELAGQLKYASQKRIVLEIGLIRLCRPEMETSYDSLVERIKNLEEQLSKGLAAAAALAASGGLPGAAGGAGMMSGGMNGYGDPNGAGVNGMGSGGPGMNGGAGMNGGPNGSSANGGGPVVYEKAIPEDLKVVAKNWSKILSGLSPLLRTNMKAAKPSVGEGNVLMLVFEDELDKTSVDSEKHMAELKQAIAGCVQKEVEIRTACQKQAGAGDGQLADLTKIIKADIEYVD